MEVFVSYARRDADAVARLRSDIERSGHGIWFDRELEGGEQWWDQILEHIRSCGLFVFALSEDSAHSRACRKEIGYAQTLGRPIVPVLVGEVDVELAPAPIPSLQIVDYRQRTADAAIELSLALRDVQPVPLPEPLPSAPEAPLVSFAPLQELLARPTLTFAEQSDAVRELRERLADPDAHHGAATLLQELRRRPDVMETIAREADLLLARATGSASGSGRRGQHREEEVDLLRSLLTQIRSGRCTPILGWGLTDSLIGPRRLMARAWAETFEFPLEAYRQDDLPQVANFVAVMTDVATLRESLGEFYRKQFRGKYPEMRSIDASVPLSDLVREAWILHSAQQPDPYDVFAELPCPIYVNAHPTSLLIDALRGRGKDPVVELCRWRPEVYDWPESIFEKEPDYVPDAQRPLVFQVFGNTDVVDSLVLTEDDYFDFLSAVAANSALVPPVVRNALADSALLLLGFRLDEWDVRVLLRSLVSQAGGNRLHRYTHVAAQINLADTAASPERARRFLERYFGKHREPSIDIFWGTVDEFTVALAEVWASTR
jgi:hypothetical protein